MLHDDRNCNCGIPNRAEWYMGIVVGDPHKRKAPDTVRIYLCELAIRTVLSETGAITHSDISDQQSEWLKANVLAFDGKESVTIHYVDIARLR